MTSQPRTRRTGPLAGDASSRARATVTKASSDSVPCNVNSKQSTQRSRSKNKLPRSVRYELENALVGNIQPQYVNCAACCSTPQTASRARFHRPRVRVLPSQPLPLPPPPSAPPVTPLRRTNYKTPEYDKVSQRPGLRLKQHSPSTQSNNWRVPSPCRTYSTIPQILISRNSRTRMRNMRTAPHSLLNRNGPLPPAPPQNIIDAIATKYRNDKGLKVLYERATQEYPSSMNLVATLKTRHKDGGIRKMPWK